MSLSQSAYEVVDMAESDVKAVPGPRPPALRPPPTGDWWDETQWSVLTSLLDAAVLPVVAEPELTDRAKQKKISTTEYDMVLASIQSSVASPPSEAVLKAFLKEKPSDNPEFIHNIRRALLNTAPNDKKQLGGALSSLSGRTGALLLTGYCTPVQDQPIHIREAILQAWANSWLPSLRVLAKMVSLLSVSAWAQTSPLLKQVTGYGDVPREWKAGADFEYSFLQFEASDEPSILETDVVVVGSGCGGAVCAKTLAEAGHSVLVIDKGYYFPPSQLPMPHANASQHMYEGGGALIAADSSINMIAGSCWGGGGSVNWSVALQTQGFVRREWAQQHGLPFFETQAFQDSLDRVCSVMGVTDAGVEHGFQAQKLLDGARRLGYSAAAVPRNCGGQAHRCGHCHFGCGSAGKKGPAVSWLPAAAKAGAKFIEGLQADLLWDETDKTKAVGVRGTWVARDTSGGVSGPLDRRVTREVVIKAKKVILSCGTLSTPLVLMKAGLTNRHIGRNLHLHPVNFVDAFYEEVTEPMDGGIITAYSTSFEDLDGHGHGVKFETNCMVPGLAMTTIPWRSALDTKLCAARWRHMITFISMARDRDSGRVYPDRDTGRPRVEYTPSAFDRAHIMEGVVALAKMCYVTSAAEIRACLPGVEPFVRPASERTADSTAAASASASDEATKDKTDLSGVADPAFAAWLETVKRAGNTPPIARFGSAHQMGSCRMSAHEGEGVVDPRGRVWGTEDLYVADASVFPSASGVNPMVTTMAIADWIARGVVEDLAGES